MADISPEVLAYLNAGEIETVNLPEWLAVDQILLIETVFPKIGLDTAISETKSKLLQEKKLTAMKSIKIIGEALFHFYSQNNKDKAVLSALLQHKSDIVRSYAPYLIAFDSELTIAEKLQESIPLADDSHFSVREVIWMAMRPEIEKNLTDSIEILNIWTKNQSENIRRFATESTRPRGVWCKHIDELKNNPEKALPILEALKSDKSKYVQDSVGNWLNDASKTRPDFVLELCERWEKESDTKQTQRIIKKARRTLDKN